MAKDNMEDYISKAIGNLNIALDKGAEKLNAASSKDLKEAMSQAKEYYKDSPYFDEAIDMLKNRGVKL